MIARRAPDRKAASAAHLSGDTPHGMGNSNRPLEEHTRDELYNMAKEKKVEGRSKMTKDELIRAVGR
jgi:hypothetical protein